MPKGATFGVYISMLSAYKREDSSTFVEECNCVEVRSAVGSIIQYFINKQNKNATSKKGDKVKVHYHGRLTSGGTFDSSEGLDLLEFEVNSGTVIKGFDDGVTGMAIGEKKTIVIINIDVDEAYGPKNEKMVIEMPKDRFPADMELEVGLSLVMSNPGRQ